MMTSIKRRRGTAIVETPKGILVVSRDNKIYNLPGGGAEIGENQKRATIRELKEETNLEARHVEFLFNFESVFNNHQVYLVEPKGTTKPSNEIKYIEYYNGTNLKMSNATQEILEQYQYIRPSKRKK